MIPLIITFIIWTLFNTFLSITAILGGFTNYKEIEAIKSWYPYGDETLIEFGKHIQHCEDCGYLHIWELKLTDNFKQQVIGMLLGGDTE